MNVDVKIKNEKRVSKRLNNLGKKLQMGSAGVSAALYKTGLMVEKAAVVDYLSAPEGDTDHLHRRLGTLAASINTQRESANSVSVGTNVEYAHIHEFGGTIMMNPVQIAAGGRVYEGGSHVIHMPARPFLRTALEDNRGQITAILKDYIRIAIREAREGY